MNSNSAKNRIVSLLDENSFVEIGGHMTARTTNFNLHLKETPSDGVITGYGIIDGNLVYVYSQDVTVLNGTVGEMHAKKILNIYDLAMKMGAPVIGLVDCAGIRLEEATDALNAFGEIYLKQTFASGVIPQITGVFGTCGGGLAIMSALSDFTFMEENKGKLFVNTPNALNGNNIDKNNTASAAFQESEAGLVDVVGEENVIIDKIRELISLIPANNEEDMSYEECYDTLNRVCEGIEGIYDDGARALELISDDNLFYETKAGYAKEMVTGFIKLNGITVGSIATRTALLSDEYEVMEKYDSVLTTNGCSKAEEFIRFCDAFHIPVLSLTNITGFKPTLESEKGIAKAVAKLTYAFANATVSKVNVITGKAFGSAYIVMNSKAIGADITFGWNDAKIGMMESKLAAKIMFADEEAPVIEAKAKEYDALQGSIMGAAQRGYVDTIIEPEDTRKYVISAFEMLFAKRDDRPRKKHGTV